MRGQRLRGINRQVACRAQLAIGLDAGADQAARAAVDGLRRDVVVALCRDHARVHDGAAGVQGLIASRIQTAGIAQGIERGVQVAAGKHAAGRIVQVRHAQGGVARHGLQLALGIVNVAAGQCQVAPCRHRAFRVVQDAHVQCGILRRHDAAGVVQQGCGFHQRITVALDLAASVIELACRGHRHEAHTRLRQTAAAVVQAVCVDGQLICHRRRIAVIQRCSGDVELAIARDLAELVVELARIDGQQAAARVLQLAIDVR
ncbi:hypothetical protein D3C81_1450120 [compost metagenome]